MNSDSRYHRMEIASLSLRMEQMEGNKSGFVIFLRCLQRLCQKQTEDGIRSGHQTDSILDFSPMENCGGWICAEVRPRRLRMRLPDAEAVGAKTISFYLPTISVPPSSAFLLPEVHP